LDVWEDEPKIDLTILEKALLATPHIAGHSLQSKYRATAMIYLAAIQQGILTEKAIEPISVPHKAVSVANAKDWRDVVLAMFDPRVVTKAMKEELMKDNASFDVIRKTFGNRFEFGFIDLMDVNLSEADSDLLSKLKGVN
jgi:erythronate-4-phosphate dehydrogenase